MPRLTELLAAGGVDAGAISTELKISSLSADSRQVQPGSLFIAIPGVKQNGAAFVPEAVRRGAVAVIAEEKLPCAVPVIAVPNARRALSQLAAAFYSRQPEHMVAVTGTDGKTSTVEFIRQFCELLGLKGASMGTLGTLGHARRELAPGLQTTPDPVQLHATLSTLAESGYEYGALEASSHGLHQYRLHGVRLEAAAFTNLTRDHLDYHGTEEDYFAAKLRLFTELLPEGRTAVINADDPRAPQVIAAAKARRQNVITFGRSAQDLVLEKQESAPHGQHVSLRLFDRRRDYELPLVGAFQVYNILAAFGLLAATGIDAQKLADAIPQLAGVPGRLEHVATLANGATAFIDYAHTPAALENVLKTLRPHTRNRLLVVFGCGGDRDRGKRPLMGKAATEHADAAIVTDDNPRTEDAASIRREVLAGAPGAKEVAGRKEAIYGAVQMLAPGDVLLVAGKGHEKVQTIGTTTEAFCDAEVIRSAIRA